MKWQWAFKKLRKHHTVSELCRIIRMSPNTILEIERGHIPSKLQQTQIISAYIEVKKNPAPNWKQELEELYDTLLSNNKIAELIGCHLNSIYAWQNGTTPKRYKQKIHEAYLKLNNS